MPTSRTHIDICDRDDDCIADANDADIVSLLLLIYEYDDVEFIDKLFPIIIGSVLICRKYPTGSNGLPGNQIDTIGNDKQISSPPIAIMPVRVRPIFDRNHG